ncbi:MAG: pilus assembly protein N-terminal domain-containing protein [Hahellaceae bacterium]|nr:pilus assembly protein N-terminal domain-containing protein [Hahellaceae bacterium]
MKLLTLIMLALLPMTLLGADRYPYATREGLNLYLGKVETLKFKNIERVAVGNEALLATSILSTGELMIIPRQSGQTDLVIWQTGNRKQLLNVNIRAANPNQLLKDVRRRLSLYPSLHFKIEDETVVISGEVSTQDQLTDISQRLSPELIHLVTLQVALNQAQVIRQIVGHIDGLEVTEGEGWISLSGAYSPEFQPVIDLVMERYPKLLNSAQPDEARLRAMVMVDVRIMEVRRRNLEKLGIRWDGAIAGPAAALATAAQANPYFRAYSDIGNSGDIASNLPVNDTASFSSVGLITQIGSTLELMQSSGEAKLLARPMLSTRDGTPSNFHSGGEIPFPIIDARTGNIAVDFRAYGVMLTVLPRVSHNKDLMVEIEAEVSSIDNAISINGVPGLVSKSVKSVVSTQEGETIVMSGLLSSEQDQTESKVPFLGDIPLIGALFRSNYNDNNQRELAIFLTPRLITPDGQNSQTALTVLAEKAKRDLQIQDWLTDAIQD